MDVGKTKEPQKKELPTIEFIRFFTFFLEASYFFIQKRKKITLSESWGKLISPFKKSNLEDSGISSKYS